MLRFCSELGVEYGVAPHLQTLRIIIPDPPRRCEFSLKAVQHASCLVIDSCLGLPSVVAVVLVP